MDASGRVSISDMATSLEGSILTEGKPSSSGKQIDTFVWLG